jgi:hypothetical protein
LCSLDSNLRKGRSKTHKVGRGLRAHFAIKHTSTSTTTSTTPQTPPQTPNLKEDIKTWYQGVVEPVLSNGQNSANYLNQCILTTTEKHEEWKPACFNEYVLQFKDNGKEDILKECESLIGEKREERGENKGCQDKE